MVSFCICLARARQCKSPVGHGTLHTGSLHKKSCQHPSWTCAGTQLDDYVQPGPRPIALGSTAWWSHTPMHAVLMALPASRGCHRPHASHHPTQWSHPTCSNPSSSPAHQARQHLKQPVQPLLPSSPAVTRKVHLTQGLSLHRTPINARALLGCH